MTFVIIEDDFSISQMILNIVDEAGECEYIGTFNNLIDYLEANLNPNFILLDIDIPKTNGLEAVKLLLDKNPDINIIISSILHDVDTLFQALQLGVIGYLDKQSSSINISEIMDCIKKGGAFMTPSVARKVVGLFQTRKNIFNQLSTREKQVCDGVLEGLSYKMIGGKCNIGLNTVRMHMKNIYKKLNINSKAELFHLSGKKFIQ
jgi:DNA-binding NarL/FixJ family response regulator